MAKATVATLTAALAAKTQECVDHECHIKRLKIIIANRYSSKSTPVAETNLKNYRDAMVLLKAAGPGHKLTGNSTNGYAIV
jgi:hypothetical protein